jgi:hypothetical protein
MAELRGYNHHMEQLESFKQAGANLSKAQQYFNCINEHIWGQYAFNNTNPMPLHTFLGVAQFV